MDVIYAGNDLKRVFRNIEEYRSAMISLQKDLTAVPALAPGSGGQGEEEKAGVLMERLSELGINDLEVIRAPDERVASGGRPNIIATIPGKSDDKRFWIMTHLDIVPPGEESLWQSDPYTMVTREDRIIGRGVEDNQQDLVASIFAALSLLKAGLTPRYTVKLLFVADEETGSEYGIQYLLDKHNLFKKGDLILVPDGGSVDGSQIEIAEKSALWLKFETKGKQCHASTPAKGINAFVAASELVLELNKLNHTYTERNKLFDPPVSTFSPTKKEANIPNINTIPGDDVFYLDCRILPSIDLEQFLSRVKEITEGVEKKHGVTITISTVQRVSSPPTPVDTPLVSSLKKALAEVYNLEGVPIGIGGGTVGGHLRQAGYDTIVWSRIAETAHMPNEYSLIDNMVGDAGVMAYIMLFPEA